MVVSVQSAECGPLVQQEAVTVKVLIIEDVSFFFQVLRFVSLLKEPKIISIHSPLFSNDAPRVKTKIRVPDDLYGVYIFCFFAIIIMPWATSQMASFFREARLHLDSESLRGFWLRFLKPTTRP